MRRREETRDDWRGMTLELRTRLKRIESFRLKILAQMNSVINVLPARSRDSSHLLTCTAYGTNFRDGLEVLF